MRSRGHVERAAAGLFDVTHHDATHHDVTRNDTTTGPKTIVGSPRPIR